MIHDMKNLIFKHQMDPQQVLKMASLYPARYFNFDDKKGSIKIGKAADFVLLDHNWNVCQTYVEGSKQYDYELEQDLINPDMKNLA